MLVIDQPNIPFGEMRTMRDAVEAFINRLSPADRVAIVGFGAGAKSTSFVSDHDQLKRALALLRASSNSCSPAAARTTSGSPRRSRSIAATTSRSARLSCATARARRAPSSSARQEIQAEAQQVAGDIRTMPRTPWP